MTVAVSQVSNTQTFGAWLATTNRLADLMSQNVVTADSSSGGSVTTGNAYVNGHFGSQFLYVTGALGGGNVSSNGVLRILANVAITDGTSNLFIITANSTTSNTRLVSNTITLLPSGTVTIGGANLTVNAAAVSFSGANISFTNSPLSGNITFTSNTVYNGSVIIANGGFGTNGSVLFSNGTGMYWNLIPAVVGNNGIIANNDGIFVNANNGLSANSTGVFVVANTGIVVNTGGVHVNSAYINTLQVYPANGIAVSTGTAWTTSLVAPGGAIVGTTDAQTLTTKTFGNYTETVFTITDGVTVNLDPNNGPIQTWTLGANRTPGQANWAAGQSITLMIDDGSAFTITWTTLSVVWKTDGGVAPTLNTSGFTVIALWKVGTTIYGARVGDA